MVEWDVRRKLSPEEVEQAISRYAAGEACPAIGATFGVHGATVRRALVRAGVAIRGKREAALEQHESSVRHLGASDWRRLYSDEASGYPTIPQLAESLRVGTQTVRAALIAFGIPIRPKGFYGYRKIGLHRLLSSEQITQAVTRYLNGESASSIGRSFDCSNDCVLARLHDSGAVQMHREAVARTAEEAKSRKAEARKQRAETTKQQREERAYRLWLYLNRPQQGQQHPATWNGPQTAISTPGAGDIAWAAGFLEAEGYFGISTIVVTQTCQEPLERLKTIFGGRVRDGARRYVDNPRWSRQWVWQVYGARARGVAMTVYFLLSERRREKVRAMLGAGDG